MSKVSITLSFDNEEDAILGLAQIRDAGIKQLIADRIVDKGDTTKPSVKKAAEKAAAEKAASLAAEKDAAAAGKSAGGTAETPPTVAATTAPVVSSKSSSESAPSVSTSKELEYAVDVGPLIRKYGKTNREDVLAILTKHGVPSGNALKAEQWPQFIADMKAKFEPDAPAPDEDLG